MNSQFSSSKELQERARQLRDLGNNAEAIHKVLLRNGASPEEADAVLASIGAPRKATKPSRAFAMGSMLVMLLLAGGLIIAAALLLPGIIQSIPDISIEGSAYDALATPVDQSIQEEPSPTAGTLPQDARTYFNVIWNLQGSYLERYNSARSAVPPAALSGVHTDLINALAPVTTAEAGYAQCISQLPAGCQSEEALQTNQDCNAYRLTCTDQEIDFTRAKNDFYPAWIVICGKYEEYYKSLGVAYPFRSGSCPIP